MGFFRLKKITQVVVGAPRGVSVAVLALAISALYLRLLFYPHLSWDDDRHIFENYLFKSDQAWRVWVMPYFGMYIPITSTIWAILLELGAGAGWPFRILNVSLHIVNTFLVSKIILLIVEKEYPENDSRKATAVFLGSALFALHPLQVGTVAWISGGRDLLAIFFGLLATLFYFKLKGFNKGIISSFFFILSLLSKPQLAALPIVLILVERRFTLTLVTWALAVLGVSALTFTAQESAIDWSTPLWFRPVVMLDTFGFYLTKLFYPGQLAADYGRTPQFIFENPRALLATLPTLAFCLSALFLSARKIPGARLAVVWFLLLLPVSGVIDFGFQKISTVADHYNYAPMIVISAMVALVFMSFRQLSKPFVWVLYFCLMILLAVSWVRVDVWKENRIFFSDMLAKNPVSLSAMSNLAVQECTEDSSITSGLKISEQAVKLAPFDPVANTAYVRCLFRARRHLDVIASESKMNDPKMQEALKKNQFAAAGWLALIGVSHAASGNVMAGFPFLCRAFAMNPYDPLFRLNLEMMKRDLSARGQTSECR